MEGGNKVSLNLEAGLDVNTSDMLVPVNQNTWQHNWQKCQGKFLPNSLRFEKNGWAAGWNVYDFKYNNIRSMIEENLYASNMQLTDIPTYMVSLYNAEYSADVLKSYIYTKDSRVIHVSNGTAEFDPDYDNTIHCAFHEITCDVVFDTETHDLSVDNESVTINYVLQKDDNSYKIILIKNDGKLDVDVDFKAGMFLDCDQFIHTVDYKGFLHTQDSDEHKWNDNDTDITQIVRGSQYVFDPVREILTVDGNNTAYAIYNDNEITFNYSENRTKDIDIRLNLRDYVNEYNNIRLTGNSWDSDAVISAACSNIVDFNKIKCDFSGTTLDTQNLVTCDIKVPLWFTASYKPSLDTSLGAWEPDNVYCNAIHFICDYALDPNTTYKARSVFEPGVVREGTIADFTSDTKVSRPNAIKYRYNQIIFGNSIAWKSSTALFRLYKMNQTDSNYTILLGNLPRWPGFNTALVQGYSDIYTSLKARIRMWMGDAAWDLYGPAYKGTNWQPNKTFKYNNCFDDNTLRTVQDLSNIRSIIPIAATAGVNNRFTIASSDPADDEIAVLMQEINTAARYSGYTQGMEFGVKEVTTCPGTVYSEADSPIGIQDTCIYIYNGNSSSGLDRHNDSWDTKGRSYIREDGVVNGYSHGTYKEVPTNFDVTSSDYWPFKWVPCFNITLPSELHSIVHKNVYAVLFNSDTQAWEYIDSLSDFKKLILGTYHTGDLTIGNLTIEVIPVPFIKNAGYTRQRIVTRFRDPLFDFNRTDGMTRTERLEWSKNWKAWYPGVIDPQSLSSIVDTDEDSTYTDLLDISIKDAKVMTVTEYETEYDEYVQAINDLTRNINVARAQTIIDKYESDDRIRIACQSTQPGCVIAKANNGIASLVCFNTLGIVPWKSGTQRVNDITQLPVCNYNVAVYQNHINETDKYSISVNNSTLNANIVVNIYGSSVSVPFTFANYISKTGKAHFAANLINVSYSVDERNTTDENATNDSYSITGGGCSFTLNSNSNTAWLNRMTVQNGALTECSFKGNISSDVLSSMPVTFNHNYMDGVNIAGAIYGHAGIKLKYNKETAAQELNRYRHVDGSNIYYESETPALEILALDDNEIAAGKIYVDRNTVAGSYNWLRVYIEEFSSFTRLYDEEGNLVKQDDIPLRFGSFKLGFLRNPDIEHDSEKTFKLFYGLTDIDAASQPRLYTQYYPNVNNNVSGNTLDETDGIGGFGVFISGIADTTRIPINAEFIAYNDSDVNHKFFVDGLLNIRNMKTSNDNIGITKYEDMQDGIIQIPVFITKTTEPDFIMEYDTNTGDSKNYLTVPQTTFNTDNTSVTFNETSLDFNIDAEDEDETILTRAITGNLVLSYNNVHGNFVKILTNDYNLLCYENGIYTIDYNGQVQFDYNMRLNKLASAEQDNIIDIKFNDDVYTLNFILGEMQTIIASFNYIHDHILTVQYRGEYKHIDMTPFESDSNDVMSVEYTDIRLDDHSTYLGDINANTEFQIVKQQWNSTVEVENFWWIDRKHILELNTHYFVLKRNTLELDDWNGNRWEKIFEIPKLNIIGTEPCYYTVLNSYNSDGQSYFMLIKEHNNMLRCTLYDVANKFVEKGHIDFMLRHINIGQKLNTSTSTDNTAYFNTYSNVTVRQILSQAKWTNTIRNNRVFIGCHLSNNFDQWAVVCAFDSDNNVFYIERCIQGYGFVSITGDLTGGQIPEAFFDKDIGFSDRVHDLETLTKIPARPNLDDIDAAYIIENGQESRINETPNPNKVFGTAEKQWYIDKEVKNIVSHLTYDVDSNNYTVQVLPFTNVYEAVYKSPSFRTELLFDNTVVKRALMSLFSNGNDVPSVWSTFVNAALNPDIYLYAPKVASIIYLQQTLGQYAYVHHNSSSNPEVSEPKDTTNELSELLGKNAKGIMEPETKAPLISDELTFDKQIIKQEGIMPYTAERRGILFLFNIFLPAIQAVDKKIAVNEGINWNTVNEVGDVFTQSVSENLTNVMIKSLHSDSPTTGISSTVVGIKSLDMFYSTCENQRVFAGPGFVEHQFVANCSAQSVTDVQVTSYVMQLSFVIKVLSTWKLKLAYLATTFVHELASKTADYTANTMIEAAGSGGNFAGVVAAIAALAALQVAKLATRAIMIAQEEIEGLIDLMADKMKADAVDSNINGKTETEGKHKYGEKNEYFMWPCWGVPEEGLNYTDETVVAGTKQTDWALDMMTNRIENTDEHARLLVSPEQYKIPHSTMNVNDESSISRVLKGSVPLYVATCYGKTEQKRLPRYMAKIEGVPSFLPTQAFKNQNISVSEPSFTPSLFQDYIIDVDWQLSQCVTYGLTQWVTCKDTKLINCAPSNVVITEDFCGIAAPYIALEIKRGLSKAYMRPYAVTPNILAFNCTGYNSVLDNKLYHSFDGISYRIVDWTGSPGMNKNNQTFLYCFQVNDRFKRSNKFPANEVQGNFDSEPAIDVHTIDKVYTLVTNAAKEKGLEGGTIGEDKDVTRWAIPVFTELINTMPAAVKTMTAMQLNVFDGITALTTNVMNNQTAYKAPASVDFTIGKNTYRYTNDYICQVQTQEGIDIITEIVPVLGLTFVGASLTEAYFYSKATRFYYVFTGNNLVKMDMFERFRDIKTGTWDFINHEVVMPCLMTYTRLDPSVKDNDTETDNIIVPTLGKSNVTGELPPPITTIFNDRSWYKTISLPCGLAYQGPNRVIINRAVFNEYMLKSLKDNIGKWKKLDRETYDTKREYLEIYDRINKNVSGVDGWTYNPFILVTSPLGVSEDADCLFEWVITFCWPVEMDYIYGPDNYAVVNVKAETMTSGGKIESRPTHIFLTKELFTRSGSYGYYSFRFQGKNGTGNRERLHIWSDQYIAISGIDCEVKVVTQRRAEILTQQIDVKELKEL